MPRQRGGRGWAVASTLVAAGHVRVAMLNTRGQPLAPGRREIARLQFGVDTGATAWLTALDLEPVDPRAAGHTWTASDGSLLIGPAPVWHNGANPLDVNGDGATTALDALLEISYLFAASQNARHYDRRVGIV